MLERERGELTLTLDDGATIRISDKHLTFKLQGPTEHRISVYRLRILQRVPEHLAAGYSEPVDEEAKSAALRLVQTDSAVEEHQPG